MYQKNVKSVINLLSIQRVINELKTDIHKQDYFHSRDVMENF